MQTKAANKETRHYIALKLFCSLFNGGKFGW